MPKFRIYGNRSEKETPVELQNRLIARKAAAEGMVLLENRDCLPLKPGKIALYGAGARLTVKGGTGSGDVHERYSVNIEDGLKNHGFTVVSTSWLERFTETYEKDQEAFRQKVEAAIKGYPVWKTMEMFIKIGEFHLAYPVGDAIREEDLSNETDTCVYVIARQAGEGADRKREKGDYLLSDLEVSNLKTCRKHYKKLVVIVNSGSSLDLQPLEEIRPDAVVFYGQAGEEGGNALGMLLSGEVNFSGRLSDSWALKYEDLPLSKIAHPEKLEENYEEGIYVGYRYFDAAGVKPLYPFGHGLSFTSFERETKTVKVNGSAIDVRVRVTNTGSFEGKEIVLAFVYKPNEKYDGEVKSLASFNKTSLLKPGESEELVLSFDLADFAVYDETKAAYVLEQGLYGISIGTDAEHDAMAAALRVKEDTVTEQCRSCCVKKAAFKELSFKTKQPDLAGLAVYECELKKTVHDYRYRLPEVSDKVKHCLDTLSDEELAMYTMGGGYSAAPYIKVMGSCGNTTSKLVKKGIPPIIMSDGPAGINIMPKAAYTKNGSTRYIGELPKEWQWGWLKTVMPKLKFFYAGEKDLHCYQYCTAWPNATLLAQSFNTELAEKVGNAVGKEMLAMGITLWLAPALNIHRDPLCGRNFEYYSEDPLLSGKMAAAVTRGVQKNQGVGVTIKHFACNNREDDRIYVSSNVSERALREIYLKGFRIAAEEQPMAVMSSYNRLNGVYTADNKELLIDILRCEWGYEGLVMSDWDGADRSDYASVIKNGNNMIMPGGTKVWKAVKAALKSGQLRRSDVMVSALYGLKMVFEAKTTKDFEKENRK